MRLSRLILAVRLEPGLRQTIRILHGERRGTRRARISLPALLVSLLAGALPIAAGAQSSASSSGSGDRIIVSGASGHLGELTTRDLLARGIPANRLILVTRTPDKLSEYARMGASVRYGDFTKPSSLPAAFEGGSRMLLISIDVGAVPRPEAHKNAISAAVAAGVKHIVYTSWIALSSGDRTGLGADHFATEQILEQSGVAWTFLRNSTYMEELLPVAKSMAASGAILLPPEDPHIGLVARADCAAVAAAVLSTPGHDRKAYNITGATLVGARELAAAVSAVTGREVAVRGGVAPGATKATPSPDGSALRALSIVSNDVEKLTGQPPMTLRAFLEQHRAELLQTNR